MQTDFMKVALMGAWALAVGAVGYLTGTTSVEGWTLLAMASLAPLAVMARLRAPAPTMSESIRKALR